MNPSQLFMYIGPAASSYPDYVFNGPDNRPTVALALYGEPLITGHGVLADVWLHPTRNTKATEQQWLRTGIVLGEKSSDKKYVLDQLLRHTQLRD